MRWPRKTPRFLHRAEGAAAVEFALVLPLLLLILCGIMDFGRLFFEMQTVSEAARAGARLASVTKLNNIGPDVTSYLQKNYGNDLKVTITPSPPVSGKDVTVKVSSDVHLLTPGISAFFPGNPYPVTASCTMKLEN